MKRKVEPNEFYIERLYDAPVRAVWEAWTDPAKVEKWWGPRGFSLTSHSKDLRDGGHWHYTMHGPDGTNFPNKTIYHEVQECQKLVYDHGANDEQPPLFRVTALFSESNGKTLLQLTMRLETPEAAASICKFIKQAGGNATWDRLAEHLSETLQGEPSFVINRSYRASVQDIFRAWTTPELLCKWLPPSGFTMEALKSEIRKGGSFLSRMSNNNEVTFCVKWDLLECSPSRISYMQTFCDENGRAARHPGLQEFPESLLQNINITEEEDGMTRVTLTTTPFASPSPGEIKVFLDIRNSMTTGWTGSFDALEILLAPEA